MFDCMFDWTKALAALYLSNMGVDPTNQNNDANCMIKTSVFNGGSRVTDSGPVGPTLHDTMIPVYDSVCWFS